MITTPDFSDEAAALLMETLKRHHGPHAGPDVMEILLGALTILYSAAGPTVRAEIEATVRAWLLFLYGVPPAEALAVAAKPGRPR